MYRLLELRPDGAAYRGTCPSCWYKGALFLREGTTGGGQLFCLEKCTEEQIRVAMAHARFEALPPDLARLRPCDAARVAAEAHVLAAIAKHEAARVATEEENEAWRAHMESVDAAHSPTSDSKH